MDIDEHLTDLSLLDTIDHSLSNVMTDDEIEDIKTNIAILKNERVDPVQLINHIDEEVIRKSNSDNLRNLYNGLCYGSIDGMQAVDGDRVVVLITPPDATDIEDGIEIFPSFKFEQ